MKRLRSRGRRTATALLGGGALAAAVPVSLWTPIAHASPALVQLECPEGGTLGRSWTRAESYVYACTYGAEPWLARPDVWAAEAIAVYKLTPGESEPQLVLRVPEHQRPVEYWVDGDRLVVVQHTQDPRERFPVPFARQTVAISGDGCEAQVELMLEPETPNAPRIAELLTQLRQPSVARADPERVRALLFELRNQGLRDPAAMASKLRSLQLSGAAAAAHAQILGELALAARSALPDVASPGLSRTR